MNKYLELKYMTKRTKLEKNLRETLSKVKDLEKEIEKLKDECNHTYVNERTSILKIDNTGPGGTVYRCDVCGKTGNWIWAEKYF